MKKFSISLIALLFSVSISFAQSGIELDNETGTSMKPIINSLNDVVDAIEDTEGIEIVHIEFDLLFSDSPKEIYRNLSKDYTYGFMAYGDYRIEKVGIDLYRESENGWEYVKSGELNSGAMTLLYEVSEAGFYKISLRALQMVDGYNVGHYGLVVIHD